MVIGLSTAKTVAFATALSFAYPDAHKVILGTLICFGQALCWWTAWRGLGVVGVGLGWGLQTLYLALCWSYFSYFGLHLTWATALSVGREGATAVSFGVVPLSLGMLWLLADVPALLWWCWCDGRRWPGRWSAAAVVLLLSSTAWLVWRVDAALQWAARERDDRYTAQAVFVRQYGLLPLQLQEAWRAPSAPSLRYGPETEIVAPVTSSTSSTPSTAPRDLLVIQVESLDVGGIERAMPHLAQRAAGGVWFPRCLSYHGPGGSSDCDVAVIEGVEPLWMAVSFDQPACLWPNSWVMRLRRAGWQAALAHGLPGMYFNFAQVMPRLGYELWDIHDLGLQQHPGEFGARDNELVEALIPRLAALPSPFVLHVVTMSSHTPFVQYRGWWRGPDRGSDYDNALAATDAQLERLISAFLARSPQGVVVLFGDHAAGLPTSDRTRGPEGQREYVPLVFLNSGAPARRDPRLASFLDIGRTVLPLVGWQGRLHTWGADLLPADQPLPPTRIYDQPLPR